MCSRTELKHGNQNSLRGAQVKQSGNQISMGSLVNNITTSALKQESMSLSGFLTCRPDLVVMVDLCAPVVNLIGTSASVDAGWSVSGKCGLHGESCIVGTTGSRSRWVHGLIICNWDDLSPISSVNTSLVIFQEVWPWQHFCFASFLPSVWTNSHQLEANPCLGLS